MPKNCTPRPVKTAGLARIRSRTAPLAAPPVHIADLYRALKIAPETA
jgi:hypothetical protein